MGAGAEGLKPGFVFIDAFDRETTRSSFYSRR